MQVRRSQVASRVSRLARYWARLGLVAAELSLVLLVIVLLLALARQMETRSYQVMGYDTDYYLAIGQKVVAGLLPYRDFGFEYPPLALPFIVMPAAVASAAGLSALSGNDYAVSIALENLLVVVLTSASLVWLARRGWSARSPRTTLVAYLGLVCATPILFLRFDSLPALLTVLAVCALAVGKSAWSGLAVAAGTLTKLYPVALLPALVLRPVMARSWREAAKFAVAAVVPVAAGIGLLSVTMGAAASGFLGYQSTRGVQLESVPASITLVAHALWGTAATTFQGFGSWQVESPFLDQMGWLWPAAAGVMVVALGVATIAAYRRDVSVNGAVSGDTQVAMVAASVALTLLAYRVLSPQYLVWLLPFAALLPRGKLAIVLAIGALTLYVFPFGYEGLVHLETQSIVALALRNALLLALFIALVAPGLRLAMHATLSGRRQSEKLVEATAPSG